MLRTTLLLGSLISSFASEAARVRIFFDDDAILDTPERRDVVSRALRQLLAIDFGRSNQPMSLHRCSDAKQSLIEVKDLVAVPDLAGGAFAEMLTTATNEDGMRTGIIQRMPDSSCGKIEYISRWFRSASASFSQDFAVFLPGLDGRVEVRSIDLFNDPSPPLLLSAETHRELSRRKRSK
jgi:hypothetical protein